MNPWSLRSVHVLAIAALLPGCDAEDTRPGPIRFEDVADSSGIDFVNTCGGADKDYVVEINGGGVALFDFDLDGELDIFLVNGSHLPRPYGNGVPAPPLSDALFRNLGGWEFQNVTATAGLTEAQWGVGVTVGDFDTDGDPDLYVTNYGPNRLWKNNGDGTFADVTESAGVGDNGWGASCAFFDYDRDGGLDLFVVNYLEFDPAAVRRRGQDPTCRYRGIPVACGPNGLPPALCTLYRNRGDGTFADVSDKAGIREVNAEHFTYGLGVAIFDADCDGWLDIYVANDTRPNLLFRNQGDGTFQERAMAAGVALNEAGVAQAGMGVDTAFLSGRDAEDIFVVNFANDSNTFYRNDGSGFFMERTAAVDLAHPSHKLLGWGTFFFDADLDGRWDLFVANGHVAPQVDSLGGSESYRQVNQLFLQAESGKFVDMTSRAGVAFDARKVSRGAAFGDLDGDGDADIVINELDGKTSVLKNVGAPAHHWLSVKPQGTRSNRDAIGAVVTLRWGEGRVSRWRIRTGSSYASQSERVARFGLGAETRIDELQVTWPDGKREVFPVPGVDRRLTVVEGSGCP